MFLGSARVSGGNSLIGARWQVYDTKRVNENSEPIMVQSSTEKEFHGRKRIPRTRFITFK